LITADWTVTGQGASDRLGNAVTGAGDVNGDGYADVIVAAYGFPTTTSATYRGKVYAYHGASTGLSTTDAWTASGENDGDRFGVSVAGVGDVNGDGYGDVLVGAHYYPTGSRKGKAYLFLGSSTGLLTSPAWTFTGEYDGDLLGVSVARAGDVNGDGYADVAVGAPGYDSGTGRVYVFHGGPIPSGLETTVAWTVTGEAEGDLFGGSLAGGDFDGDGYSDLAIGAKQWKVSIGRAYAYFGDATGLATEAGWTFDGETSGDTFGISLAAAGDVNGDGYVDLLVGANGYDEVPADNAGKAYAFLGGPKGPQATAAWSVVGESAGDQLGRALSGAGDIDGDGYADVLIGAPWFEAGDQRGFAYLYRGSAGGLEVAYDLYAFGEADGDLFASALAGAGDVNGDGFADMLAGAPAYPAGTNQGKAYAFYGYASRMRIDDSWSPSGDAEGNQFGYAVAGAGDVNADGYSDVLVGEPDYGTNDEGRVQLFLGSDAGLDHFPDWTVTGEGVGNRFGYAVAGAGDVNGDGYADVIVGARGHPAGSSRGKVYVYYGSGSGLPALPNWTMQGEATLDGFGSAVAGAGDLNGDGYADILIGAPDYPGSDDRGKVYAYYGAPSGLPVAPDWVVSGEDEGDNLGVSLSGAGDVNGDGYADVILGASGFDNGVLVDAGKAYVYAGSPAGLEPDPTWTEEGMDAGKELAHSVAGAGDINGDGYGDVLVGVPLDNNEMGRIYLYYGTASGVSSSPDWTDVGEYYGDHYGDSVAAAGDVNGDGYADFAVSAPSYEGGNDCGEVRLYYGALGVPDINPGWQGSCDTSEEMFGAAVAAAGDVDADGFADLIVGAAGYINDTGRAYLALGNKGAGRPVRLAQFAPGSPPQLIQPWGLSGDASSFALSMRATSAEGRTSVKLQVEACPPGVAFGETGCVGRRSTEWTTLPVGVAGKALQELVVGLQDDTLYRWRARILYAPFFVNRTGITSPPNPAHGPWRRLQGQTFEADLRTTPSESWYVHLPIVMRMHEP
jgi:hypothetical protein